MRKPFEIILMIYAVLIFSACSIKEERGGCPCKLIFDYREEMKHKITSSKLYIASSNGYSLSSDLISDTFEGEKEIEVPRTHLRGCIYGGETDYVTEEGIMKIPFGMDCPEIYTHKLDLNTCEETVRETVAMKKNYCCVTVRIKGRTDTPYSITFRGNVGGYDSLGNPLSGDFSCVAYPDEKSDCVLCVPRQIDSSLVMDVDDGVQTFKSFAIGEHMVAGGYDWAEPDLKDVTITMDYYVTYISLMVQGWDGEYTYDVIL